MTLMVRTVRALRLGLIAGAALVAVACGDSGGDATPMRSTTRVPLDDLGTGNFLGFIGGLYPNGSNVLPAAHAAEGAARARMIEPLDTAGIPSLNGNYVMVSIGMSNTTQEFCSQSGLEPCDAWTFRGQADADPAVNTTTLAIVNGAEGGKTAAAWDSAMDDMYDVVRDQRLFPRGLSEPQVQIGWVKVANADPVSSLPATNADAYALEASIGNIVRAMRTRYPNLKMVFLSNRIYAGYASTTVNPEPYAYESGFAAKWAIEAQIAQMAGAPADARAGDLNYETVAPWIAWGPNLWADGTHPRSDGLTWVAADFDAADGMHPAQSGEQKVGAMLLSFFKTSPQTNCWFLAVATCP